MNRFCKRLLRLCGQTDLRGRDENVEELGLFVIGEVRVCQR
jgi:hypothetical protein